MTGQLQDRTAVITGASGGIGAAIARRLAREGAKLVLSDLDEGLLAGLATELRATGTDLRTHGGDLSKEDVAGALIRLAVDAFGRLDVLVNNAGGGVICAWHAHTPDTLRTTIDRNLWTTVWCSWHATPVMKRQGYGRIVNVGADSVRNGLFNHAGYNAAKGGVHALTTGLAREFARDGITVNTVAPCIVATPRVAERMVSDRASLQPFLDVVPMGRPAELEEVASMVCHLASQEASFVTGQVVSVNGGSTML